MTYDGGYSDWKYGIRVLRLAHVAAQRDYWTDPVEMYAFEAGPLWRAV